MFRIPDQVFQQRLSFEESSQSASESPGVNYGQVRLVSLTVAFVPVFKGGAFSGHVPPERPLLG